MLRLLRVEKSGNLICWAAAEATRVRAAIKTLGMVSLARRMILVSLSVVRLADVKVSTPFPEEYLRGGSYGRQWQAPAVFGRIFVLFVGKCQEKQGFSGYLARL